MSWDECDGVIVVKCELVTRAMTEVSGAPIEPNPETIGSNG